MTEMASGTGRTDFVSRYDIAFDKKAAGDVLEQIAAHNLEVVRLSFADQHGVLRGKTLMADEMQGVMANGCTMTTTLLAKDISHKTQFPVFSADGGFGMPEMSGAGDIIMVPDPATFRILPWAEKTGWLLCDIYFPNGKTVPFSTRQIYRDTLATLAHEGYDFHTGLEVEFHVFKLEDAKLRPENAGQPADPPEVSLVSHGFQYLTEQRSDEQEVVWEILRRGLKGLQLPLRTFETEFGPSQFEISFGVTNGLESADNMMLFRSAVKQICHRNGYHATFMCRPNLPNIFSSGWHLHQSVVDRKTGANMFAADNADEVVSPFGRHFAAGLLDHARGASVFTTPTINGYKRYQPFTLAPDRVVWGNDNKGAMLRLVGSNGDPMTHLENRVGEPAANPYLYMASQVLTGMDGVHRKLEPPPMSDAAYETEAPPLPRSLLDALFAFREDTFFREALGDQFVDYLIHLKEAEITRFLTTVTDWEHREYFEIL